MLQNTNLGDADANLLKNAADSLEKRIELGELRAIESVLNAHPLLLMNRESVLELMYLEWVLRCERDELPRVEEYLDRFPEYAGDFEKLVRVDEVVRGVIPESGVTLAEKAAIDFDPLTIEAREVSSSRPSSLSSISIGGYTLERIIGRGGMGIVYQARQHQLDRRVALKTIDFAGSLNPRTVARFRSEAELVARLQHPNIVQVYETGSHSGMPFFSMELVDGGTLANAIKSDSMKPNLAAKLVEVLSRAIHYAHTQGIIHRDLKPANVLLARSDRAEALDLSNGSTQSSGQVRYEPKIVDFGLAKLLGDNSSRTVSGTALGTPSYMSPEQLSSELGDIGPASDVYSLGAILFELLVGQPPFHAATAVETMQQVRHDEPTLPPSLRRKLPGDLVLICMTCLRKEPEQRYASAADLANDLQRYLSGNPIQARPGSFIETALKWTKRHPSVAALMASITFATIGMTMLWWQAEKSSAAERLQRLRAENLVYARNISLAHFEFRSNKVEECKKLLAACPSGLRNWEWFYLESLCEDTLWESPRALQRCVTADISQDGRFVASCSRDSWGEDGHEPISIWDVNTGQKKWTLPGHTANTYCVDFSPDGKSLASAGVVWSVKDKAGGAKIWNLEDGTERLTLVDKNAHVIRYSPDGRTVFVGLTEGTVVAYESDTGMELARFHSGNSFVTDIALNSSGKLVASCSRDGYLYVWDTATKRAIYRWSELNDPRTVTWQPGTNNLLVGCYDGQLKKFELVNGKLKLLDTKKYDSVPLLAFSPDGRFLALSEFNDATQITEVSTGKIAQTLRGHNGHVQSLAFTGAGNRLVTGGRDGTARVWNLTESENVPAHQFYSLDRIVAMASNPVKPEIAIALTNDGRDGAAHRPDRKVRLAVVNLTTMNPRHLLTGQSDWIVSVAYSSDGKSLLAGSTDNSINYCDSGTGKVQKKLKGHDSAIVDAVFIDSQHAFSIDSSGEAKIWNITTGELEHNFDIKQQSVMAMCFDSITSRAIVIANDGTVSVWQIPTGELLHQRKITITPTVARLSSRGTLLAIGDATGKVELWKMSKLLDASVDEPQYQLHCHADRVSGLSFSPDGKRLVTGSYDESIRLIDVENGYELFELDRVKGDGPVVAYSADGKHILRGGVGKLLSWSIKPRQEQVPSGNEKMRSTLVGWHATQLKIAADARSAFTLDFHYKQLKTFAQSSLAGDDVEAETELLNAMSHETKFLYLDMLAREHLLKQKTEAYHKTCELLLNESIALLKREKNYAMAWTCCLSPESGVDASGILSMLDATRLVNTPTNTLLKDFPLVEASFPGLTSNSGKKKQTTATREYNDGAYALACYRAGKFELAIEHASIAVKRETNAAHVHYLTLAMCLARRGDLDAARKALESAKERRKRQASPPSHDSDIGGNYIYKTNLVEYPLLLAEAERVLSGAVDTAQ